MKDGEIWAVTAYFNPCRYRSRRENYRVFRERLDVPLVTAELSFDGEFELGEDEAEILVRVDGGDVMWQKERLLNVAASALPAGVEKVALLDCDIVFDDPGWPGKACRALEESVMVHLFSHGYRFPRQTLPEQLDDWGPYLRAYSTGYLYFSGLDLDFSVANRWPFMGGAWGIRRSVLERHGVYDTFIMGGGAHAFVCAGMGKLGRALAPLNMNAAQESHFRAWADPFHESVQGRMTYLEGRLALLWHGSEERRAYMDRHEGLRAYDFDPATDIRVGPSGAWTWSTEKPDLHRYAAGYYQARREDDGG
ncbi:MAG TPA: hypothetical protein VHG51_16640 [Longimicrobiaceae bacterium]|nr:hypothetical protein [Longimicrobiaceae bacterium]